MGRARSSSGREKSQRSASPASEPSRWDGPRAWLQPPRGCIFSASSLISARIVPVFRQPAVDRPNQPSSCGPNVACAPRLKSRSKGKPLVYR